MSLQVPGAQGDVFVQVRVQNPQIFSLLSWKIMTFKKLEPEFMAFFAT